MPDLKKHRLLHATDDAAPVVQREPARAGSSMDWLIMLVVGGLVVYGVYWGLGSVGVAPRYQIIAALVLGLMLVRDVIRQARDRRRRAPGPTDYGSARNR